MGRKSLDGDASSLAASIIATIRSSKNGKSMDLKELRTVVLTAAADLQSDGASDDVEKSSKKMFKQAVKLLEKDEKVSLNAFGIVKLSKSERSKSKQSADIEEEPKNEKKKKKKKEKKRKRESRENEAKSVDGDDENTKKKKQMSVEESQDSDDEKNITTETTVDEDSQNHSNYDTAADDTNTSEESGDPKDKNKPCKGNPQGVTRLFLGNLPFAISEPTLNAHLQNSVTHIKWITDKETGKFYGSAFCEVRNSKDAAKCLSHINGTDLMGRPIKINYAPVRPGEEGDWPPRSRVITGGKVANAGGKGGQAGGAGIKAMSIKPEGCCKLFLGNLSYDINDEGITKFFAGVDAELKSVRWLHHQDSGDFKGCGFADFWNSEACEKAASLNGKNLLGRPIRIDWAE